MASQVLGGASSAVVNGQLVPWYRQGNIFPRPISAAGPGGTGVPAFPPQTSGPGVGSSKVGGGSLAASVATAGGSASGSTNPWDPAHSPVPWLIGFFVVGFLLLRYVHHGY